MDGDLILQTARIAVAKRLQQLGHGVDHADYEEMVSMTIYNYYTRGNYDPTKATLQTYIGRIARNVVTDYGRAEGRRRDRYCDIDATDLADTLIDNWDTDTPMLMEEQESKIDEAVSKLNGRQQELFNLLREEHSNKEIADLMGIKASIVATEACRLKQRLKAQLQDAA